MLPGASVEVLHKPTGTKYYSTTDVDGKYAVQGLELVYTVKVTYIGYKTTEITDINASWIKLNCKYLYKKNQMLLKR
jgi:hypothetical protein